jgi:hypothetical protein
MTHYDSPSNPKQLKARFPYMFDGENIGFSFARGWFPLFCKLCEDIDTLLGEYKRGFHWVQVKEKFGYARFYWEMPDYPKRLRISVVTETGVAEYGPSHAEGSLAEQIEALVREATAATRTRCIVCGEAATLDQSDSSYVLVVCKGHANQRRLGNLDPQWFNEEEVE